MQLTSEDYKDFIDGILWKDLKDYMTECMELNRDLLEGTQTKKEGFEESDEALRGRNRSLREFILYVERMAEGAFE